MRRIWINILAVAVLFGGGWYLWHHKQISNVTDAFRLASSQIAKWDFRFASRSANRKPTIRVASFNIQAFGETKVHDPVVLDYLAQIAREFDIIAIQEVRGGDSSVLPVFVEKINSTGRNFTWVTGDPIDRSRFVERYAFIFDLESIKWDGSHSYTVQDPDDVLHREPLVGWFRSAAADPKAAFTFSLVNVHLDARQPQREVAYLAQLFRAIRADGRGEDDILIAGDFNAAPEYLQQLQDQAGLICLIAGSPTNVQLTQQHDNLLIHPLATTEFTGKSGVFDFLKVFNLTVDQATAISDHLPVWAEFSSLEGFDGNLTATRDLSNMK